MRAPVTGQDPRLQGLATALDDRAMAEILPGVLPEWIIRGSRNLRVRHRVLKHTAGKRCVVAYRLEGGTGPAGAVTVIGKLHRARRGERIFAVQVELWAQAGLARGGRARLLMPEPLGYVPRLGMLVQSAVPGRALASLGAGANWTTAVRRTAENLARLHALTLSRAEPRSWHDHLRKLCRPAPEALAAACPELATPIHRVLGRLGAAHDGPRPCAVHGDLGLPQVLVSRSGAAFVDFDGACLSDAALDLANFMVSLEMRHGDSSAALEQALLARYRELRPAADLSMLGAYRSLAYLRRAATAFRRGEAAGPSVDGARARLLLSLAARGGAVNASAARRAG